MIRKFVLGYGLLLCFTVYAQSAANVATTESIGTNPMKPKVEEQCGMSMQVPDLKNVTDQSIGFGCLGSYKGGNSASIGMDFQYDPNFDKQGGDYIEFSVYGVGIDEKVASGGDSIFRFRNGGDLPTLWSGAAYAQSNCGPVTSTKVTPIYGSNWHGWIAEETFGKPSDRCKLREKYTSRFRCIHVMVGNDKMTAQLDGVCLLRKREISLENGFSYDLFMDMLKTLRFKEQ